MARQAQTPRQRPRPQRLPPVPLPALTGAATQGRAVLPATRGKRDDLLGTASLVGRVAVGLAKERRKENLAEIIEAAHNQADVDADVFYAKMKTGSIPIESPEDIQKILHQFAGDQTEGEGDRYVAAYKSRISRGSLPRNLADLYVAQQTDRQNRWLGQTVEAGTGSSRPEDFDELVNQYIDNSPIPIPPERHDETKRGLARAWHEIFTSGSDPDIERANAVEKWIRPIADSGLDATMSANLIKADMQLSKMSADAGGQHLESSTVLAENGNYSDAHKAADQAIGLVPGDKVAEQHERIDELQRGSASKEFDGLTESVLLNLEDGTITADGALQSLSEIGNAVHDMSLDLPDGERWEIGQRQKINEARGKIKGITNQVAVQQMRNALYAHDKNVVENGGNVSETIQTPKDQNGKPVVNDEARRASRVRAVEEVAADETARQITELEKRHGSQKDWSPELREMASKAPFLNLLKSLISSGITHPAVKGRFDQAATGFAQGSNATDVSDWHVETYRMWKTMDAIQDSELLNRHVPKAVRLAYGLTRALEATGDHDEKSALHSIFKNMDMSSTGDGLPEFDVSVIDRLVDKPSFWGEGEASEEVRSYVKTLATALYVASNRSLPVEQVVEMAANEFNETHFYVDGEPFNKEHLGDKPKAEAISKLAIDYYMDTSGIAEKDGIERDDVGIEYDPATRIFTLINKGDRSQLSDSPFLPLADMGKMLLYMKDKATRVGREVKHKATNKIREAGGLAPVPWEDAAEEPSPLARDDSKKLLGWLKLRNPEDIDELVRDWLIAEAEKLEDQREAMRQASLQVWGFEMTPMTPYDQALVSAARKAKKEPSAAYSRFFDTPSTRRTPPVLEGMWWRDTKEWRGLPTEE
jgi:hypothetical protein